MLELAEHQQEHLKTIQWLISDNLLDRASGRSFLLAWAFVHKAVKRPDQPIWIFDHIPVRTRVTHMMAQVRAIAYTLYPEGTFEITKDKLLFREPHNDSIKEEAKENSNHQTS